MSTSSYHPTQTSTHGREFVPPIPRASKGRIMRRGVRRFFGGIGAALRIVFSGRPLLVAFLALLLPFTGWLLYARLFAPAPSALSNGARVVVKLPEPPVAQQYFTAVQKGDADAIWNTFSATEKARRIARGENKTTLSRVLQLEQQAKMTYTAFHYVGSYLEPSGSMAAFFFYVGDTGSGQQVRNLPLLFAVDSHGMIVEVSDSLYDAALAQLKGGP